MTRGIQSISPRYLVLMTGCLAWTLICGGGCDSQSGKDSGRKFVTIGTAPGGGAFAQVGNAISNVINNHAGDLNWSVTAQGTKGTQENIRKLEAGDIEFGMANAAISYFAVRGEGDWETPREIRVVATMAPNVGVFVTTAGSGINSIADLKGKRVILGPSGAGFEYFLKPLLAVHGVQYEDMTVLNGNYLAASEMMGDGKADAAFMGGAIPIPAVTSLCATQDVVFLKFDPAAPEKLMQQHPFYFPAPITADKYSDLEEDITGINVGSMQLVTHAKVDEETVYNMTKLLYENRDEIAEQHPAGKALAAKNIVRDTGTPFHPGAIRYFKEIGIWPAAEAADSQ